uniref:Uncharacterized protein n=1 Tax=Ditylenchus dipsaci TaxID=166011 RepID=A0A915EBF3_9BILA
MECWPLATPDRKLTQSSCFPTISYAIIGAAHTADGPASMWWVGGHRDWRHTTANGADGPASGHMAIAWRHTNGDPVRWGGLEGITLLLSPTNRGCEDWERDIFGVWGGEVNGEERAVGVLALTPAIQSLRWKSVVYIKMNDARRTSDLATEVIRRWATAGHKFEGSKLGASAFKFAGRKKLPSVMNQFVIVGQPTVPDPLTRLQAYLSAGNCAALLFSWLNVRQNATILIGPAVLEFGNTYGHINLPTALRMNQSGLWNAADYGGAEVIFAVERVVHVPQYIAQLDEFVKNNSGFIL